MAQQWVIKKSFEFDYGHRVHNQSLNQEYSIDNACVCRHLHGHRGVIEVALVANKLNDGMVTDFKHLNWFKQWIDDTVDHKMIMDIQDPLIDTIFPLHSQLIQIHGRDADDIHRWTTFDNQYYMDGSDVPPLIWEIYEGLVVVNFVPTSENLSKWFFEILKSKMNKIGVTVHSVLFKETPKSESNYSQI